MKYLLSFVLLALIGFTASRPTDSSYDWGQIPIQPDLSWAQRVGAMKTPKSMRIDAARFGLKNDTSVLSTRFIQNAIDSCCLAGGGTVVIPAGAYRTGALFIKSGVNLHFSKGAMLIASEDIDNYPEFPSRIAGIEMVWPSAVLNIIDAENAAITGEGVIDCRGKVFWDKYWAMRKDYEQRKLRWIVDYDCKRVRGILVSNSQHVTLKDFTLMRTGFWACQILYSDQCSVNGITINNNVGGHGPSTDGIDVDSSTNILIENCVVDCNDDNICIKAGRDADGLRVNRPTENVVVRNCVARRGSGLITCGSETSGSIRNVLAYDLKASGTGSVLRLKSSMNRGGTVENIFITRVAADSVSNVLGVDLNWHPKYSYSELPEEYKGKEIPSHWKTMLTPVVPKEKGYPYFRNVYFSHVKAENAKRFISASGWNDSLRIENFYLSDIVADVQSAGKIMYGRNIRLRDVELRVKDKSRVKLTDNVDCEMEIQYK